jgi:hypothetical protein
MRSTRLTSKRGVRSVIVVGVLTTIATSAPQGFSRDGTAERTLQPGDVAHVTVVFNRSANDQADHLGIEFFWTSSAPATLIPDDPAQPTRPLTGFERIEADELCVEAGPCTLGFSIESGSLENAGTLEVTAVADRAGDASFCFPDNREFSADAAVEVTFDAP